jgi:putative DNA primase/helicase
MAVLSALGIDEQFLRNKHGPCPVCGGKDRFRYDDKRGHGEWICNQCGSGDGFTLLEKVHGWSFREALRQVESVVGSCQSQPIRRDDSEAKARYVKKLWMESEPVSVGDPVWRYLHHRVGLDVVPSCIRFHPAMWYSDDDAKGYYPAMVAAVADVNGKGVAIHRTYLTSDGLKAKVEKAKKLLAGNAISGGAVRLSPAGEWLGITEGIETALAASRKFSLPVWSAVSAGMMEQWIPPAGVKRVVVFGDSDKSFTGQAAAYALAKKLTAKGLSVDVRIPEIIGKDWADQ